MELLLEDGKYDEALRNNELARARATTESRPVLVVNGRVYVPNYDNAVNVYGILR